MTSFLKVRLFYHGWHPPCWSRMLCFGWKTIEAYENPITILMLASSSTRLGEPGSISCTRSPQICTGSPLLKLSSWGFWKKDDSTEPEPEKGNNYWCFTTAARHAWAHGGTRCLAKQDFLWLALAASGLRSASLMGEANAWVLRSRTKQEIKVSNTMSGNTRLTSVVLCLSSVIQILLLVMLHSQVPRGKPFL